MKDRIIRFMTSEGLSSSRLADEIGVQRSSVSHLLSGRNNPSYEFIQKLLSKYPRLNAEWLIMGSGPMYKDVRQTQLFSEPTEKPFGSPGLTDVQQTEEKPQVSIQLESGNQSYTEKTEAKDFLHNSIVPEDVKIPTPSRVAVQMILVFSDNTFKAFPLSEA